MYTGIQSCLKTNGDAEGRGAASLIGPLALHCLIHTVLASRLFIHLLLLKDPYVVCLSNSIF